MNTGSAEFLAGHALPGVMARLDMSTERWELVQLAAAIWQPVLILVLCAAFVLASAHLLTMLGTRWGKRRVSLKALIFSITVHLILALGIISLWPEAMSAGARGTLDWKPPPKPEIPPERFQVKQVPIRVPQPTPQEPWVRPVWEQMTRAVPQELERTPVEQPLEDEAPPERPEPDAIAALERPEVTPLPASEAQRPTPVARTETGPTEPAAVPLEVDDLQAEARPEVEVPSMARERNPAVSIAPIESEPIVRPNVGAIERVSPDVDPNRDVTSVAGVESELATLQRNDETATIERREGPAPSTLDVPEAGIGRTESADEGQNTAPLRPQIARERTRSPQSVNETGVERYRPAAVPREPTPSALEPVQSMLAAAPSELPRMERPDLAPAAASQGSRAPAPYQLRSEEQRGEAAQAFGGSPESEAAVELSLKWLAKNQSAGWYWEAAAHGGGSQQRPEAREFGNVGRNADTGVTGLALLAFLGHGHTYEKGDYTTNVERGLKWLISQQGTDGSLTGRAGINDAIYCHAIATFALAEAYAMRSDDAAGGWLRGPVERAIEYTLSHRTPDGGWRYDSKTEQSGDMSIFGWQLMALKSAELGGIPIPEDVRQQLVQFLMQRSSGTHRGLAAYRLREQPSAPMTAEALFCKQILGMSRDNPASQEAVNYIRRSPPHISRLNYYYWYYGTLAMYQYGGQPWEEWNAALRDLLVQEQRKSGPLAGSWDPRDIWGPYGGRVYSTAMATLCLEVYYRYLPLYRLGETYEPPAP